MGQIQTSPTTRNPIAARDWVRKTHAVYQAILGTRVNDDAPLEEQHRWWRLHDATKREYAIADWQYESLILKTLIGLAVLVLLVAVLFPAVIPFAGLVIVAALWRTYVILTRHAPD